MNKNSSCYNNKKGDTMEYTKIKISLKEHPKRLYRIIAVKDDPDLYQLGAIIGLSIEAWFEHIYMFYANKSRYVVGSWVNDEYENDIDMADYKLSDLGNSFKFEYDTGEGYVFDCKVYNKKVNYNEDQFDEDNPPAAFVIEGAGMGIFENNHYTLDKYLYGHIDPESSYESLEDEDFQVFPENIDLEKYGDFDKPLDIENMYYEQFRVDEIANHYKDFYDERNEYIYDIDENEDDFDEDFEYFFDSVAGDIFKDENINAIFKELLNYYDLNEAFSLVLKTTALTFSDTDFDGDYYQKRIDDLKKLLEIKH